MGGVGATLGVEEEFHLLDPVDGGLVPGAVDVVSEAAAAGGPDVEPELLQSTVETATPVCRSLDEVRASVVAARRSLLAAAAEVGLRVAACGTVPDSGRRLPGIFPKRRYEELAEEYQQVAREQMVCACQVQVGVPDRELAVALLPRVQPWLPVLLALSVSSPYFDRRDTGYGSYRTQVWSRWPTAGPASSYGSAAAYDSAVSALVSSGVIRDAGMIYFDVRPSARYPTVEVRIADSCPLVDDVMLLAALGRALVATEAARVGSGSPPPSIRCEMLRAASWRASRSGMTGDLIDPFTASPVPAGELLARLVDHVSGALSRFGDAGVVAALLADRAERGTSADRQRVAHARRGDLRDVVSSVVTETAAA